MEVEYENSQRFPIGLTNKQCIGPCYPAGKYVMHPITLTYITDPERPFCPTNEWFNEKSNKQEIIDICLIPSVINSEQNQQIGLNFMLPTFYFNCEYFLKTYYDIYSFESAIDWITINGNGNGGSSPIYSQLRIIECAWKVYGATLNILNDQLINFYLYVIKKEWIKNIYPIFSKYIKIDKDNIFLSNSPSKETKETKETNEENKIEKINYFLSKFINKQNIYKVLSNYIKINKNKWESINSHNSLIEEFLIEYIFDKVKVLP